MVGSRGRRYDCLFYHFGSLNNHIPFVVRCFLGDISRNLLGRAIVLRYMPFVPKESIPPLSFVLPIHTFKMYYPYSTFSRSTTHGILSFRKRASCRCAKQLECTFIFSSYLFPWPFLYRVITLIDRAT